MSKEFVDAISIGAKIDADKSFKDSIPNLCTHLRTIFSLSKILFSDEAFLKTSIR